MTGQELFHALSFVDERYIAEAETAKLGARIPWVKVLSVAACLCILIVGAFALENIGHKGATEAAPEAAAPQAAPEAMPEAAPEEAPEAAPPMPEAAPEAAPEAIGEPAVNPEDIYVPTVQVFVRLEDQEYLLEEKEGMKLLNLMRDQTYDVSQICRCDVEFTVITEFGVEYGVNLKEGFVRCERGQAFLNNEDMQKIQTILDHLSE